MSWYKPITFLFRQELTVSPQEVFGLLPGICIIGHEILFFQNIFALWETVHIWNFDDTLRIYGLDENVWVHWVGGVVVHSVFKKSQICLGIGSTIP